MAIKSDDHYIQPNGSTTLMPGDRLFILPADKSALESTLEMLQISNKF